VAVKTKRAVPLSVVASGVAVKATTGGVTSPMVQEKSAGVPSTLPSTSLARTAKSCSPTARPE